MELLVSLRFGTFPFEERAIFCVTCGQPSMERSAFPSVSILLEGGATVSNKFTKRRYRHKIQPRFQGKKDPGNEVAHDQARDTFEVLGEGFFKLDSYLHNLFLRSAIF